VNDDGNADDDGVVAGQQEIAEHDLRKRGQLG
jgi:hypothetical protein